MRDDSRHTDTLGEAIARCAKLEQNILQIHIWGVTISTWASSGVARSNGARCGKAPSGSAGITSTIDIVVQKHFDRVSKSFPAWTVTRDFWERALKPEISGIAVDNRLFHESGRRLIHKYWVYQDPLPHPALREGRITRLLSFVNRAMVIAQLTHLRIAIPSSGNPPGEVPSDCFPRMDETGMTKTPKRVTFAPVLHTSTGEIDPPTTDQNETPTESPIVTKRQKTEEPRAQEIREESTVPPPGFSAVSVATGWLGWHWWCHVIPGTGVCGELVSQNNGGEVVSTSSHTALANHSGGLSGFDYGKIGSPISELYTPAGLDRIRSVNRRRPRQPMKMSTKCEKPAPAEDFLFRDIFCEPGTITNRSLSESTGNKDRGRVPRWRLAREGPFPNERSQASLRVLGKGCAFRHMTYNVEDHAPPEGRTWCPVKSSPLPGMDWCSGIGLAPRNESRPMVWHLIPISGYDGGNATT